MRYYVFSRLLCMVPTCLVWWVWVGDCQTEPDTKANGQQQKVILCLSLTLCFHRFQVNLACMGQCPWPQHSLRPSRTLHPTQFLLAVYPQIPTGEIGWGLINIQLLRVCYYTAIDGWYNYTLCHLAKWLCNPNEFLFKHWLVSAGRAVGSGVNRKWEWKCKRKSQ